MAIALESTMTADEFLVWEREQSERHHYVAGEVFAMSGGTARHSFLSAQMIGILRQALRGNPCQVYTADLRLGLQDAAFVYADAVIVCPPLVLRAQSTDVVTNPSVLVEVLSKSTEAYDRGDKLARYLALPSVKHVMFVSQRSARVELYSRQEDGTMRFEIFERGSQVELGRLGISFPVDELYEGAFDVPGD